VYTCSDYAYAAFLNGRAIAVFGNAFWLQPDPCARLCSGLSAVDCTRNPKYQACFENVMRENVQEAAGRVAGFKHPYGPPQDFCNLQGEMVASVWRDVHTQTELDKDGVEVEIDDLDADAALAPTPEKLYGLIVVEPLVGFASFSDASQVGSDLSEGGLSVNDFSALAGAVNLPKHTLVVETVKIRAPESGSDQARASGTASRYLVVSGPYKGLLVLGPHNGGARNRGGPPKRNRPAAGLHNILYSRRAFCV